MCSDWLCSDPHGDNVFDASANVDDEVDVTWLIVKEGDARSEALGQSQVDEDAGGVVFDDAREARRVVGVVPFVGRKNQLGQGVRNSRLEQSRLVLKVQGQKGHRLKDEAEKLRIQRVIQRLDQHPQLSLLDELVARMSRLRQEEEDASAEDLQTVVAALTHPLTGRATRPSAHHTPLQCDGVEDETEHRSGVDLLAHQLAQSARRLLLLLLLLRLLRVFALVGVAFGIADADFLQHRLFPRTSRHVITTFISRSTCAVRARGCLSLAMSLLSIPVTVTILTAIRRDVYQAGGRGDIDYFVDQHQRRELNTVRAAEKFDGHVQQNTQPAEQLFLLMTLIRTPAAIIRFAMGRRSHR